MKFRDISNERVVPGESGWTNKVRLYYSDSPCFKYNMCCSECYFEDSELMECGELVFES